MKILPEKAFIGLLCVGLVACRGRKSETELRPEIPSPDKHPNILWIVGENIALDLGCYG